MTFFNFINNRLTYRLKQKGGRNNQGLITVRCRGGGVKRRINLVDNFKLLYNMVSIVLENNIHDCLRSSYVSLVIYKNGIFSLILKPRFLQKGSFLNYSNRYLVKVGCTCPLRFIPEGVFLNSVNFMQQNRSQIGLTAGTFVFIINKFSTLGNKILVRFPSTEEYLLNANSIASLGRLDNITHNAIIYGKAGVLRRKGRRPHVRGVAMNPVDHPHGGNTSIGRHPVSPTGKCAKGGRTRSLKLRFNFVYRRRKNKKK